MKRKLDKNKIGFAIAFIVTTALLIQKSCTSWNNILFNNDLLGGLIVKIKKSLKDKVKKIFLVLSFIISIILLSIFIVSWSYMFLFIIAIAK